MGNTEILSRGSVQLTSAGTGIRHSEKAYGAKDAHFLQIWSLPSTPRLTPKYYTRRFTDEEKTDAWVRVVAPAGTKGASQEREADGPAPVHSALTMYATLLNPGKTVSQAMQGAKGYVQVVQTSGYNTAKATGAAVRLSSGDQEVELKEGDGAYLTFPSGSFNVDVENVGERSAEVILFDLE